MSDTVVAAIVGAVAGIITGSIGSLFAPWANWGIEKRKQKLAHRRELIAEWRKMITRTLFLYEHRVEEDENSFTEILERKHEFFSLQPHLSPAALKNLKMRGVKSN